MIPGIKPLKIGNVEIGFPVVQAALSGYSDWAMRMIARRMGASYSLCEVMLDQFLVSLKDRKKTQHFLYNTPVPQSCTRIDLEASTMVCTTLLYFNPVPE